MIYTADQWSTLELAVPDFIWNGYIPDCPGLIFLHGPGSVGKSALMWALQNAVESGDVFLGQHTRRRNTLLISTDMNIYTLHKRWKDTAFIPKFSIAVVAPFNINEFPTRQTSQYKEVKDFVTAQDIKLIIVDTLGKCHQGLDGREETTVAAVYEGLTAWFPEATIVGIFHNRKAMRDDGGGEIITDDDFRGSRKWADDPIVQLQLRRVPGYAFRARLYNGRNQVAGEQEPLDIYLDLHGKAELWDDARANTVVNQWSALMTVLSKTVGSRERIAMYMERYNVSRATAFRDWKIYKASQARFDE